MTPDSPSPLRLAIADIERHTAAAGWDVPAQLYALVEARGMVERDPDLAAQLGAHAAHPESLIPVEQDALPPGSIEDTLSRISWPPEVAGCAYVQEVVALPSAVERDESPDRDAATWASSHPLAREVRVVVGVMRDGSRQSLLRMRGVRDDGGDEVVFGDDLAPGLADALAATLRD